MVNREYYIFHCIVLYILISDQNCLITLIFFSNNQIEMFYVYLFQIMLARWHDIVICHLHVGNLLWSKCNKIKYFHTHWNLSFLLHLNTVALLYLLLCFFQRFLCWKWQRGPTGFGVRFINRSVFYWHMSIYIDK